MRGWRKDWGLDWGMVNWGYGGGGRGWFRRQSQMIRQKKLSDKK